MAARGGRRLGLPEGRAGIFPAATPKSPRCGIRICAAKPPNALRAYVPSSHAFSLCHSTYFAHTIFLYNKNVIIVAIDVCINRYKV